MNTEVQTVNNNLPQTSALSEPELFNVLKSSLYVGAQDESIKLVLGYCQAAGLDPMLKPVHIVPMYCATGKKDGQGKDIKAKRDVIMPGIGMYRIQASRSGEYAGASEPEYGEDVTEDLSGTQITYPKWCKITVKRMLSSGSIAEFPVIEFWKENYATKNRDSMAPNAMWGKRPYGQIAKCAEAQALRKAFPEFGSAPTVDEMEGKEIDVTTDRVKIESRTEKVLPTLTDEAFMKKQGIWKQTMIDNDDTVDNLIVFLQTKYILTDDQKFEIHSWGQEND